MAINITSKKTSSNPISELWSFRRVCGKCEFEEEIRNLQDDREDDEKMRNLTHNIRHMNKCCWCYAFTNYWWNYNEKVKNALLLIGDNFLLGIRLNLRVINFGNKYNLKENIWYLFRRLVIVISSVNRKLCYSLRRSIYFCSRENNFH